MCSNCGVKANHIIKWKLFPKTIKLVFKGILWCEENKNELRFCNFYSTNINKIMLMI